MTPRAFAVALSAAVLMLCACNLTVAGGSSSTETGEPVNLTGRVAGGNGDGISGVIVALTGTDLADTTDILGEYRLEGRRSAGGAGDTLRFTLNGQTVAAVAVTSLVGEVPEVQIVQRGFSGTFSGPGTGITRIEGVVTGDGIAPGDSVTATFYHNTLAGNYSGFIWFPPPGGTVKNYSVHINVYGANNLLTGRSQDVPFSSLAGNIVIPSFDPGNLAGANP